MELPVDQIEAMQPVATVLFALAVVHTFASKYIRTWADRQPPGSAIENLLHFLGEIEVVFGFWAALLVAIWAARFGTEPAVAYVESVNFTEAVFVFVVMAMAATRPVLYLARTCIEGLARRLPFPRALSLYVVTLIFGPLLGSFITEPAAMTVTALLLRDQIFRESVPERLRYATLGLLFVNVSVGGIMTHFAAPPVLMVAGPWGWTTPFMMAAFGWKAILIVTIGTVVTAAVFRKSFQTTAEQPVRETVPLWLVGSHLAFLTLTIVNIHHTSFIVALFLFFLAWCSVTKEHQSSLRIRESLLVGFFLGGLVALGKLRSWWLQPLLAQLGPMALFWGALGLTSVTDNAAITYLGTLVPELDANMRYLLVAGAVAGGGLTVIANAPNPAGYGILSPTFGDGGVSPIRLFLGALPYTLLAAAVFLAL